MSVVHKLLQYFVLLAEYMYIICIHASIVHACNMYFQYIQAAAAWMYESIVSFSALIKLHIQLSLQLQIAYNFDPNNDLLIMSLGI